MTLENFNQPESLANLKEKYKQRLDAILEKQLTVENIETFADEALNETIQLADDITNEYDNNPELEGNKESNTREKEDEAFKILELPNIQDILESIQEKKEQIAKLKDYLIANVENVDEIITPPEFDPQVLIENGNGNGFEYKKFPRLLTLVYILEHDFGVLLDDLSIVNGKVSEKMMRRTPYVRVEVPDLDRVIYICDEDGNASYVFDTQKMDELGLSLAELDVYTKEEKKELIGKNPGVGLRLIQTKFWRNHIGDALKEEIPELLVESKLVGGLKNTSGQSEFFTRREKKERLSYEELQKEVQISFDLETDTQKKKGIVRWYKEEQKKEDENGDKKHPNWPVSPSQAHAKDGWTNWPNFVGQEKKEWLSFEDFQKEASEAFELELDTQKKKNVFRWYSEEQKKHSDWPADPPYVYAKFGWKSYVELIGQEKKEWLSFEDFQKEVLVAFDLEKDEQKKRSTVKWYKEEQEKHPKWPVAPDLKYSKLGWSTWLNLVGQEKREFLSFEDFQVEVSEAFELELDGQKKKNVFKWYLEERKKHSDWPADPCLKYPKESGWKGYPELVGIHKQKEEFLGFSDFRAEVREALELELDGQKKKNVILWYKEEQKKHPNWPRVPISAYKKDGLNYWSDLLVGEKKKLLDFETFRQEVQEAFDLEKDEQKKKSKVLWYAAEEKKHPNWPASPYSTYKNKGWENWSILLRRE